MTDVRVPVECREADAWRPVVWAAMLLGCLVTLAALAWVTRDFVSLMIWIGDLLGVTAR